MQNKMHCGFECETVTAVVVIAVAFVGPLASLIGDTAHLMTEWFIGPIGPIILVL